MKPRQRKPPSPRTMACVASRLAYVRFACDGARCLYRKVAGHHKSPKRLCSAARAARPAVSVRRMRGPSAGPVNPALSSVAISPANSRLRGPRPALRRPCRCEVTYALIRTRNQCQSQCAIIHQELAHPDSGCSGDLRKGAAPALFTGADDHALPVRQALFGTALVQLYRTALGRQRHDRVHAQFHCLLNHQVHLAAADQGLRQHQP